MADKPDCKELYKLAYLSAEVLGSHHNITALLLNELSKVDTVAFSACCEDIATSLIGG